MAEHPVPQSDPSRKTRSSRFLGALDYVMLLRPTVLMPVWTMTLLGAYQSSQTEHGLVWLSGPLSLLWTLLLYTLIMGAVYILNQLADAETDALNNKLYLIAQGDISCRAAWTEAVALAIAGYAMAGLLLRPLSTCHVLLLLSGVIGVAYSIPPFRLKGKPVLDLLANAAGYGGIAYMVGWTCINGASWDMVEMGLPYVFCVGAAFVHSTLLDREGDRQGGDYTTGVALGVKSSCILSFLLTIAAISSSLWSGNTISLLASLLSLPLFGYTLFRHSMSEIALVMRVSVALLTLITAFLMPIYLAVLVLMIFGVRWYYQKRFGVRYPF